jgi:hypothetical protein
LKDAVRELSALHQDAHSYVVVGLSTNPATITSFLA